MIYTVTFNPALDYVVRVTDFCLGATNRCEREELYCGGKGINVSLVLHELGIQNTALGFIAGFTGTALKQKLNAHGITTDFILLPKGFSRINIKLKSGEETEINGRGPQIDPQSLEALYRKLDALRPGDTLVLAGSIPATLPADIYEQILRRLSGRELRFVVDAAGSLLERVLPYRPFLIKPNHHELGELAGTALSPGDGEQIAQCARRLQRMGARNVLVSMAGFGALLVTETGEVLRQRAAQGVLKNSVGAGDSMVAGFLAGYSEKGDYRYALRLGTAAGGATAFSDGLAARSCIEAVLKTL
ncbi:1-phosphofructokinase [Faecalicatena sp. BF-R-105]|nr:1-phosphofructokinase [Faecalicatena sp. BF-R-105]